MPPQGAVACTVNDVSPQPSHFTSSCALPVPHQVPPGEAVQISTSTKVTKVGHLEQGSQGPCHWWQAGSHGTRRVDKNRKAVKIA